MAKVKLNQSIVYNGQVTTISEMDSKGLITFREVKMHSSRTEKGYTMKYFADITESITKNSSSGWEINKTAYLSRTGCKVEIA